MVFVEFHVDNVGIKTLISFKICYSKWIFFYKKNFSACFSSKFLKLYLYIFCDDFKPSHTGMFCFTFCFSSIHTTLKCCVKFVFRWQRFAIINADFFSLLLDFFSCFFWVLFFWLWIMNMCTWLLTRTVIGHVYTCIDFETLSKVNIKCLSLL